MRRSQVASGEAPCSFARASRMALADLMRGACVVIGDAAVVERLGLGGYHGT